MDLRYGTNPHQRPARLEPVNPGQWPIRVLAGEPSYINVLDAINGWQLVHSARQALGRPTAASIKHVSPAGVALAGPLDQAGYGIREAGAITSAYLRARDADPKSSYGDFAAVSDPVDTELAEMLRGLVCDGIVAPDFAPGVLGTLPAKKGGRFLVLQADPSVAVPRTTTRQIYGLRLTEPADDLALTAELLSDPVCGTLPPQARDDLLLGLIVLRYTQSNSVAYIRDGATLGIGAGQQSRVDCARLAGAKVDTWWLRRHPDLRDLEFRAGIRRQDRINWQVRCAEGNLLPIEQTQFAAALDSPLPHIDRAEWLSTLENVSFVSDGALPFRDNVDTAAAHGVRYIAEPGGSNSARAADVLQACREHDITLIRTGVRLFHH
jgi:phosphoribosylaminoimidazolecarboxamide formyltransferase/IMP cyclohydrolase